MYLINALILFFLTACTYSVTLSHTVGQGSGDIQEAQTDTPDVTSDLSLPLIAK